MTISLNPESRGMGQTTGGTHNSDRDEAVSILQLMAHCSIDQIEQVAGERAGDFVTDLRVELSLGAELLISGKRLFWLRDIKDKLIERGIL